MIDHHVMYVFVMFFVCLFARQCTYNFQSVDIFVQCMHITWPKCKTVIFISIILAVLTTGNVNYKVRLSVRKQTLSSSLQFHFYMFCIAFRCDRNIAFSFVWQCLEQNTKRQGFWTFSCLSLNKMADSTKSSLVFEEYEMRDIDFKTRKISV
jgi:hypothetical protein